MLFIFSLYFTTHTVSAQAISNNALPTNGNIASGSAISDWKKEAKIYNKYICNFWFVHSHSRLSSDLQRFIS